MSKHIKLIVQDHEISMLNINKSDYICLTDMIKANDGDFFISDWLRNRNTLEYLAAWESLNNPNFNYGEFAIIKEGAGLNTFKVSVKEWCGKTNAIGITATTGRYGGTYAHKDIAFNFGMWISPVFQLYIVTEYQRLKDIEANHYNLEWDVRRILSKANYSIHTDAVQKFIIPKSTLPLDKRGIEYANEAEILNLALYGYTSKEWKEANPTLAKTKNMRDFSSINELLVMSNLEVMNAEMIKLNTEKKIRFTLLHKMAKEHMEQLSKVDIIKSVRKKDETTYVNAKEKTGEELEGESKKSILEINKENLLKFKKDKESNSKNID